MNRTFQIGRNKLTLLQNGTRFFPQLCADIDAAQRFVYLETYIFAADETGRLVSQALQRAALRHVTVRVLLDGIGSAEFPQAWVDELRTAGVEVQWFRRETGLFNFNRFRLRRLHRKLAVIDGEMAYVGGINILNDIPEGEDFDAPRLDYAVRVHGALAQHVHEETSGCCIVNRTQGIARNAVPTGQGLSRRYTRQTRSPAPNATAQAQCHMTTPATAEQAKQIHMRRGRMAV